jgi:hypothetical protein
MAERLNAPVLKCQGILFTFKSLLFITKDVDFGAAETVDFLFLPIVI